ncbi:MAG: InlB B-repeat-containing protein, partial [Coprobacillaceae bacterium]
IFITNGGTVIPSQVGNDGFRIEEPTRKGYTFDGWSSKADGSDTFDFENTKVNGVVFVYAKWVKSTSDYTVVYWFENVESYNSDPTNPEHLKNYNVVYSNGKIGKTGDKITVNAAEAGYAFGGLTVTDQLNFGDFVYSDEIEVSANGQTKLNVYYNRIEFTFNFDVRYGLKAGVGSDARTAITGYTIEIGNGINVGNYYTISSPNRVDIV